MDKLFGVFEKYVSAALIVLGMLFVCYQMVDLGYHFIFKMIESIQNKTFSIDEKGKPVASLFFSILLLLEIIQTIKVFSKDHTVKVKIILIVGLIAVTRKILIFDMEDADPIAELAIAALIISLSVGYYLVSKSDKTESN
jgi:uncharacterized membrane protein (DUF373 family)